MREGERVFFVGAPWKGHGRHSGYEVFCNLVGRKLWRFPRRELPGVIGKVLDRVVGRLVGRRYYTVGNLLTELYALLHLLTHPNAHYHVLYGDSDTVILARVLRRLRRSASTTLHLPSGRLPVEFSPLLLAGFATIVFLAEEHRKVAQPLYPWADCVVVEHPVDTDFFSPGVPVTSGAPSSRTLLSVGGHLRDFGALAEATRRLRADGAIDELVLVGVPSSERHHLDDLVASGAARHCEGISDTQLRDLYREAGVVVLSLDDAYANNALLEAMACGSLIVATDVGAVGEYLGDTGLRCQPHDPADLAATIVKALDDSTQAAALRAGARERSLQFGLAPIADRFLSAIRPTRV